MSTVPRQQQINFTGRNSGTMSDQNQSSSCADLVQNNNNSEDKKMLKALLPGYRTAPDYETAISKMNGKQQKNRTSEPSRVASDPHLNVYSVSQPDIHRVTDTMWSQQRQQRPDVTSSVYYQNLPPNVNRFDTLPQQLQMMRINKRPPPYPVNWLSTPDLALASYRALNHQVYVSGSSPDLLLTRTSQQPSNTLRYRQPQSRNNLPFADQLTFVDNQTKKNAYRLSTQALIGSSHQLNEPIYENQIYESQTNRYQPRQSNPVALHQQNVHHSQSLESINQRSTVQTTQTPIHPIEQTRLNQRQVQFEPLNRSQSTNFLDSHTTSTSKEKKKRRWKFWGGRGKSVLSEKSRDSEKSNKTPLTKEEEMNSRHRWATGLPRLPVPTTISKEKLVSVGAYEFLAQSKILFDCRAKYWKRNSLIRSCMSNSNEYQSAKRMQVTIVHCTKKIE